MVIRRPWFTGFVFQKLTLAVCRVWTRISRVVLATGLGVSFLSPWSFAFQSPPVYWPQPVRPATTTSVSTTPPPTAVFDGIPDLRGVDNSARTSGPSAVSSVSPPRGLPQAAVVQPALALPAPFDQGTSSSPASAASQPVVTGLDTLTTDPHLLAALQAMAQGPAASSLKRLQRRPTTVAFRAMREFGQQYAEYDALAWMSRKGEVTVYVNEKHRSAPPQALAALLAHEALHDDTFNSVQEEIAGWQQEAASWSHYRRQYPALAQQQHPLIKRLNRLADAQRTGQLEALVRGNAGYRNLPESAPFQASR